MEMGRVQAITANQGYGEGIIFVVFASAVIGGVSLQGGRGNMVGVATGVALLSVVQNILDLKNVNNYWVEAVYGLVILVALIAARLIGGAKVPDLRTLLAPGRRVGDTELVDLLRGGSCSSAGSLQHLAG